jgi:hypothetical protein
VDDDSDSEDEAALAGDEDGGGLGPLGVVVAGLLVAAAGSGTYLLYRRYRAGSPEAGEGA